MSRARKVKKWNRYHEYELTFWDGVMIFYGGPDERHARLTRMHDKRYHGGGWGWLKPVPQKYRR